jgi:CHAT domain-containing protein
VATLWSIQDESTPFLLTEFYQQLQDPSISRAGALRRAQLKLMRDTSYDHPFFWSPFILINNWL